MELTFTNLIMIVSGVLALTIAILVYAYFNGGTNSLIDLLLGVMRT